MFAIPRLDPFAVLQGPPQADPRGREAGRDRAGRARRDRDCRRAPRATPRRAATRSTAIRARARARRDGPRPGRPRHAGRAHAASRPTRSPRRWSTLELDGTSPRCPAAAGSARALSASRTRAWRARGSATLRALRERARRHVAKRILARSRRYTSCSIGVPFARARLMTKRLDHRREAFRRRRHRARARRLHAPGRLLRERHATCCRRRSATCSRSACPRRRRSSAASGRSRTCPRSRPNSTLKPIEKNEDRLKVLLRLIKRKDVDALINACDAGREGELIFRYIVQYAKTEQADRAAVAAVDDAGGDPRRLRRAAQRRGDAAAGRRRRVPLRVRLAGRHQRHARDDRVQLEGGRLPADDGRPRADADARDPGRARGEDPRVRAARLLGGARHVPRRRPASTRAAGSTRSSRKPRRRPRRARRAAVGRGDARARSRRSAPGKPGVVTEETKPTTQMLAAALRPHQPAARGQRPLRLLGAHDAVARAGALREAQGADLSAHRFARAAGGLPRHGEEDARGAGRDATPTARSRARS